MAEGAAPENTYFSCDASVERPIRITEGPGGIPPITILGVLQKAVKNYGDKVALGVKRDGAWVTWTYNQYYKDVLDFARSLISIGHQPHQCVSILGFNSPEWFISDIGAIAAGGLASGIYTTNGPDACDYILSHSKSVVVVVENETQYKKVQQIRGRLPDLKAIVQWSGNAAEEPGVYTWKAFMELGKNVPVEEVEKRIAHQKPSHACTLIYTSGTTGPPKAVMLSHDNITWTAASSVNSLSANVGLHMAEEVLISYLPLSHIAAQIIDMHAGMTIAGQVYFAQPDALKGSLGVTLKEVRPTIFFGVPRVWEKIMEKMVEVGRKNTGVKKSLATWARGVGLRSGYNRMKGEDTAWGYTISNFLVFSKVKQVLGFDRTRYFATGAAPFANETFEFFLSLDMPICELYGMSEGTGGSTVTKPSEIRLGSVGKPLPGVEVKIDNPDDGGNGEICWRSRNVMMGYMRGEKETKEALDPEGWLRTGDIGRVDPDGYVYITGRIKELIITAGGENVAPILIEDALKLEVGSIVSNVMVVGDRRKFLACLFTLKQTPIPNHADGQFPFTDELHHDAHAALQQLGSTAKTVAEAQNDPVLKKFLEEGIARYNKKATSNAQCLRAFRVLEQEFAVENDLLTPSLKLKRRIVVQRYAKLIDDMYEEAEKAFGGQ